MLPKSGDVVYLTDDFIYNSHVNWAEKIERNRTVECEILKVRLKSLVPFPIYEISFLLNSSLMTINLNSKGCLVSQNNAVSSQVVFEEEEEHDNYNYDDSDNNYNYDDDEEEEYIGDITDDSSYY